MAREPPAPGRTLLDTELADAAASIQSSPQEVPRSQLPPDLAPEEGMALQAQQPDGNVVSLTVTAVSEDAITVDANHPLAGKALNFDIELVEIG